MLRARHTLMILALALFPAGCMPMGCSGEDPEQDLPEAEQFTGAVEQALPAQGATTLYGTWTGEPLHTGSLQRLVLMSDGRYNAARAVQCIKAPCDPLAENGNYKLYMRQERTYMELLPQTGRAERYEYALTGTTMRMRPLVPGSEWNSMTHASTAWCGGERDCNLQSLPTGPCAGKYACAENACSWKCGTGGNEQAAVDPNGTTNAVAPGAERCPKEGDCVRANGACTKEPRDLTACATVKTCQTCFPGGWDPKDLPEVQNPRANPVLAR